jgi:hypothetical protein
MLSAFQLSATAMLAAQTTEESQLEKKAVKIVVLMEPTMAADEATAVEVAVNSTDIATPLEGETNNSFTPVQIC